MINANMKLYNYSTIGELDEYGQPQLSSTIGVVKMAINITNQSINGNVNYKDATYLGITQDKNIDDTYVITFGEEKLKVLYVNKMGRYTQVFMAEI